MTKGGKNSKKNTESESERSTTTGDVFRLREFIYLDYPKLTSYFAQIKRGVTRQKSRIKGGGTRDIISTPEMETEVEVGGSVGTDGSNPINLSKVLGLVAEVEGRLRGLSRTGGDEFEKTEAEYLIETKELHHDVYDTIEAFLTEGDMIESNIALQASKRAFYKVSGKAEIIDYNDLLGFIENFNEFSDEFTKVTGNSIGTVTNAEALSHLLKRFFSDRLGVLIHGKGGTASALFDAKHLTTPMKQLLDNYSRQTYVDLTLFGLKVDQPGWTMNPFKASMAKNLMSGKLVEANRAMDKVHAELRLRGDIHIFPIAVYLETQH